jgi:protein-disulfide isomerase
VRPDAARWDTDLGEWCWFGMKEATPAIRAASLSVRPLDLQPCVCRLRLGPGPRGHRAGKAATRQLIYLRAYRPAMDSTSSSAPPPIGERDHKLGADRPELTLIEYGDLGCPFCFAARRPIESLLERYPTVMLVWRHFPDPELHRGADLAAELSELAAEHGTFWEAHSLLLTGRERFSLEDLIPVAERLELDPEEARSALNERRFRERVEEDVKGGRRAGVHGTPTFFINGERLEAHWRQLAQLVPAKLTASKPELDTQTQVGRASLS